ncbi:hypothetical protein [Peribacillus acanthi]|uniref:hypothetical protein n=1 Tax=Peribacillus acanthi TaxID=2171554 RepID=UPI0013006A10|nr:hypothetical protein [Peribacillus acanthi]
MKLYKKSEVKPELWKMLLVAFIGLFTFNLRVPFGDSIIAVPILPLGVWICYFTISRKNNQIRWAKYRQFAWVGFFANFFFLVTTLLGAGLQQLIYPENAIQTYVSDISNVTIINTNSSGERVKLNTESFSAQLSKIKVDNFDVQVWYQNTWEPGTDELFPYMLHGHLASWGSGINPIIYIERDGKGILVIHKGKQTYFTCNESILSIVKGGK